MHHFTPNPVLPLLFLPWVMMSVTCAGSPEVISINSSSSYIPHVQSALKFSEIHYFLFSSTNYLGLVHHLCGTGIQ